MLTAYAPSDLWWTLVSCATSALAMLLIGGAESIGSLQFCGLLLDVLPLFTIEECV